MQAKKTNGKSKQKKNGRAPLKNRRVAKVRPARTFRNGSKQGGADHGTEGNIGFHLLADHLKPMSLMQKGMLTAFNKDRYDYDDETNDIMAAVSREPDLLNAIEDIYNIVKADPKYKKLNDDKFKESTSPIQVLQWLLRKLSPIAKGENWLVDTYQHGKSKRFRFVIWRHYNSQRVLYHPIYMSLDFLPFIKKKDPELHDLIIDVVAMVSKFNKIPLWDEDVDCSVYYHEVINSKPKPHHYKNLGFSEHSQVDKMRIIYTGIAAEYLKNIKARRRVITVADVGKQLVAYRSQKTSQRQNSLIWWIKYAMELASTKQSIHSFNYVPDFLNAQSPADATRYYKFVWSTHQNDYIAKKAENKWERDVKKWGKFMPREFSVARPGQQLKPMAMDRFPEDLCAFFKFSMLHFRSTHMQYYYKQMLNTQETPSEHYMEKIIAVPLKHLAK